MSDKHPEIECYECGRLKTRLIWNSRCVTCTVQRLEANLEENDNLRGQLAALEEENERLKVSELIELSAAKARIAELEDIVEKCRQAYFAPPLDAAPKTPEDYRRTCADLLAALKGASR